MQDKGEGLPPSQGTMGPALLQVSDRQKMRLEGVSSEYLLSQRIWPQESLPDLIKLDSKRI